MKRVAKYIHNSNAREVRFKDLDTGKLYQLSNSFFDNRPQRADRFSNQWTTFFKVLLINYPDKYFIVEIGQHGVEKIQQVQSTYDVRKFIAVAGTSDNHTLAIEKAGHFKKDRLEYMDILGQSLCHQYQHNDVFIKNLYTRQKRLAQDFVKRGYKVGSTTMQQTWRLAIGLGNSSVYNNGFTFHKIYGIPYLPGQSVKGIVRAHLIAELFHSEIDVSSNNTAIKKDETEDKDSSKDKENTSELRALQDPGFCLLFGKGDEGYHDLAIKGKVIFFDAYPVNNFSIEADIMNPHYPGYYQQEITGAGAAEDKDIIPPGDWQSPVPIFFLTVKNAAFTFQYAIKKSANVSLPDKIEYADKEDRIKYRTIHPEFVGKSPDYLVNNFLKQALLYHGIGVKTAVGYGRFRN